MDALLAIAGLGIDSFFACLVIGACGLSRHEVLGWGLAFGACDAAASLLGAIWPLQISHAAALGIYSLCLLLLLWAARDRRVLLYGLPVVLSFDNLSGGTPALMAPALGAGSAVMAVWGLSVAASVRDRVSLSRAER